MQPHTSSRTKPRNWIRILSLRRISGRLWGVVAVAVILAGCGKKPATSPESTELPPSSSTTAPSKPPEPRIAEPTELDPAGVYSRMVSALAESRPEVLYDMLPPSLKSELDITVRESLAEIDPAAWNATLQVARRGLGLLRNQREIVLRSEAFRDIPLLQQEHLQQNWGGILDVFGALVEGDGLEASRITKANVREILGGPAADFLKRLSELSRKVEGDPWKEWLDTQKRSQISVRYNGSESATLTWKSADEEVLREEEWVRWEGRWIPESWGRDWDGKINSLRKNLVPQAIRSDAPPAIQKAWNDKLAATNSQWDLLEKATDEKEFDRILREGLRPIWFAAIAEKSETPAGTKEFVSVFVIVNSPLDTAARDEWQVRLADASDEPGLAIVIPTLDGDSTRFEVNPVRDVKQFSERIRFAKVQSVDMEKQTIRLAIEPENR